MFELDFDRYCVEAHDTTHFVVTSNSHENACFQLVTSYDYVGGEHVVDVVIHYDSRPITGTLNVTNTTGNTVPAGSTLAYEFEINSPDSEFDEIEIQLHIDDAPVQGQRRDWFVAYEGRHEFNVASFFEIEASEAGKEAKVILTVTNLAGHTAIFESPIITITPP